MVAVDQIRHTVAPGVAVWDCPPVRHTWRKREANPDITNPAAIYPGQSVVVPVPTASSAVLTSTGTRFKHFSAPCGTLCSPDLHQPVQLSGAGKEALVPLNDAVIIEAARAQRVAPDGDNQYP